VKDRIFIELTADLKYLRMVSLIVAKAAQSTFPHDSLDNLEDSDVFIHACELAVSEAFCNAVKHGENPSRSSCVKIKFEIEEKKLKVTLRRAIESLDLMSERNGLLQKTKNRDAILQELERKHPGITRVDND